MEIYNYSISVGKTGFNSTEERKEGWLDGEVVTPWGFVRCYAQGDDKSSHHTRIDFIFNGVMYSRNFSGKRYTKRGIKTIAFQFAKEIVDNQ